MQSGERREILFEYFRHLLRDSCDRSDTFRQVLININPDPTKTYKEIFKIINHKKNAYRSQVSGTRTFIRICP